MFGRKSEKNYVLVTHGVTIRVILTRFFKYRICEFEQLENFHNGEFVVLEYDETKGRYNLSKVITNSVMMNSDGSVYVETKESCGIRVQSMVALQETLAPYPTSPVNHFRRESNITRSSCASPVDRDQSDELQLYQNSVEVENEFVQ